MLSIEEKQKLFAIRNRMIDIPIHFPKSEVKPQCTCGEIEEMAHIINCEILNEGVNQDKNEKYKNIFNGTVKEQIRIYRKFEQNMRKREKLKTEPPCDPQGSASLCSSVEIVMD